MFWIFLLYSGGDCVCLDLGYGCVVDCWIVLVNFGMVLGDWLVFVWYVVNFLIMLEVEDIGNEVVGG